MSSVECILYRTLYSWHDMQIQGTMPVVLFKYLLFLVLSLWQIWRNMYTDTHIATHKSHKKLNSWKECWKKFWFFDGGGNVAGSRVSIFCKKMYFVYQNIGCKTIYFTKLNITKYIPTYLQLSLYFVCLVFFQVLFG